MKIFFKIFSLFKLQILFISAITLTITLGEILIFYFLAPFLGEGAKTLDYFDVFFPFDTSDYIFLIFITLITFVFILKNVLYFIVPELTRNIGTYFINNIVRDTLVLNARNTESRKEILGSLELVDSLSQVIRSSITVITNLFILLLMLPFGFYILPDGATVIAFILLSAFIILAFISKLVIDQYGEIIAKNIGPRISTFSKIIEANNEIVLNNFEEEFKMDFSNKDSKIRKSGRNNTFISNLPRSFLDYLLLVFIALTLMSSSNGLDISTSLLLAYIIIAQRFMPYIQLSLTNYSRIRAHLKQSEKLFKNFDQIFKLEQNEEKSNLNEKIFSISCHDVEIHFQDKKIINYENYTFTSGINVLTGTSGKGKTVLMDIIAGIIKPTSGKLEFNYKLDSKFLKVHFFKDKVFYLRQSSLFLFEEISKFIENFKIHNDLIFSLGINEFKNTKIQKLSGGQLQRLYISAALSSNKDVILLDEPSNNLNQEWTKVMVNEMTKKISSPIFLVTSHDKFLTEEIKNQKNLESKIFKL
tara:strand:- start:698 stop:2287 length:1590 start_codon:yes stop_codon:yes gene_type:complete